MDDQHHATAAVLDQTEAEKFLTFTPSDEDLEKAADGTPWAQKKYLRTDDLLFRATCRPGRSFAAD